MSTRSIWNRPSCSGIGTEKYIQKSKRRKTPGPGPEDCDLNTETAIEFLKELSDESLESLRQCLEHWWEEDHIPEELVPSRVVLIFKKGNSNNLENYRPISLLSSVYKIFAAILQKQIEETIDCKLQRTQYGFRRKKGTAQAIHIIRRIMDTGIPK